MINTKDVYDCSFRCFFDNDGEQRYSTHYQPLAVSEIPRWVEAYCYTHPTCQSISVKVWLTGDHVEQKD